MYCLKEDIDNLKSFKLYSILPKLMHSMLQKEQTWLFEYLASARNSEFARFFIGIF